MVCIDRDAYSRITSQWTTVEQNQKLWSIAVQSFVPALNYTSQVPAHGV